jgi:hypothetical protein
MDTLHLGRAFAALGILLVFIFWGFAVSLAHESLPIAPLNTVDLRVAHEFGSSQAERSALIVGMDVVTGFQSKTPRPLLERCAIGLVSYTEPTAAFALAPSAAVKVSLPISKSVLLL